MERELLYGWRKEKVSLREIGRRLGRDHTSPSDELKFPVLAVSLGGTIAMAADAVTSPPGTETHDKSHYELMKGKNFRTTSPIKVSLSK